MVKSAATSILEMVYNLAKLRFNEVPYQTERPQAERNPSIQNSNPLPLKAVPISQPPRSEKTPLGLMQGQLP